MPTETMAIVECEGNFEWHDQTTACVKQDAGEVTVRVICWNDKIEMQLESLRWVNYPDWNNS